MTTPIDWNDQRAFLAVLEGGSLSAGARALRLTQPTVRARIEALERALGTKLFTRSPHGLLPTNQAVALGDHVRAMAHASDAFQRAASAAPGAVAGIVRLSVAELIGVEVLPPMLMRLHERHPDLSIELSLSDATANLTEQEADIAVRMNVPTQNTLIQRKVGEMAIGLFAERGYLARRGAPAEKAELAGHDFIMLGTQWADELQEMEALLPALARAHMVVRTDSLPGQLAAARAGLGIVVMPQSVGTADPRLLAVLPEVVVASLPVFLVTHQDLRGVPRISATFDHLAGEFARYLRG